MFAALFRDFGGNVALLDSRACIVAVNEAWKQFARDNGAPDGYVFQGQNYLSVCEAGAAKGEPGAASTVAGLVAVMSGAHREYQNVYPCHSPREKRWFRVKVQSLLPEVDGMLVSHILLKSAPAEEPEISPGELN
jgi:hypothetical protein